MAEHPIKRIQACNDFSASSVLRAICCLCKGADFPHTEPALVLNRARHAQDTGGVVQEENRVAGRKNVGEVNSQIYVLMPMPPSADVLRQLLRLLANQKTFYSGVYGKHV